MIALAGTFASLKWRLVRNGLRRQRGRMVLFVLMPVFGLVVVAPVFGVLAHAADNPADARTIAAVTLAGVFAGWVVFPILGFGSDDTLDPANLALLPLTPMQMAAGMLAAAAIGPASFATVAMLSGLVVGFGANPMAVAIAVAAATVMLFACLVSSRLLVTTLSGMLRSRRGRDIGVTIGALLGVGIQLLRFAVIDRQGNVQADRLTSVGPWVRWIPPGLVAHALDAARTDHIATAFAALAMAGAEVAVLIVLWGTALGRVLTSAETNTAQAATAGRPAPFPGALRYLPHNRAGAVAMKELRYLARDPRRRAAIIPSLVFPLIPVLSVLRAGGGTPKLVVTGAFTAVLGAVAVFNNQFGTDGPAYWLHVAVDGGTRADLTGKNLAALALGLPVPFIGSTVLALATGGWAYLPFTWLLSIGVLGVLLGAGNVVSVRFPQPLPESRSNMWATRSGQGCAIALISLLAFATEIFLLVPIIVATVLSLTVLPGLKVFAVAGAVGYGAALWWIGRNVAASWLENHQPEMLEHLSPRQA